jgi:hypothetical protein
MKVKLYETMPADNEYVLLGISPKIPAATAGDNEPVDDTYISMTDAGYCAYCESIKTEELQWKEIISNPVVIVETAEEKANKRKAGFYNNFIKTSLGCIRLNVNFNGAEVPFIAVLPNYSFEVATTGKLKAGRIVFYNEPAFTDANSLLTTYENTEMTPTQYSLFLNEVINEYLRLNKIR